MPATITPTSPTSGPLSLSMYRNKSASFAIAVTQADGTTPQDLTGGTLWFHAIVASVVPINKSSPSSGITITSLTGGMATLQIEPADTVAIPIGGVNIGSCELSLQIGSEVYELAAGTLTVSSNVGTP